MVIELVILPKGKARRNRRASETIAKLVQESGLRFRRTLNGVLIEGDWDQIMALVQRCHDCARQLHDQVRTFFRTRQEIGTLEPATAG